MTTGTATLHHNGSINLALNGQAPFTIPADGEHTGDDALETNGIFRTSPFTHKGSFYTRYCEVKVYNEGQVAA